MAKGKKVVFVIVEGLSDSEALENLINKHFSKNTVYVKVMHCDITTEKGTNSQNILKKVTEVVKTYALSNHFSRSHFQQVIHILDTDWAYIPDENIVFDSKCSSPKYYDEKILTKNIDGIKRRNQIKSGCLDVLSRTSLIWSSIKYQAYYMSCNLDHVLYNKRNLTDEDKEKLSSAFANKYKNDLEGFKKFICNNDSIFKQNLTYRESWDFIRNGCNSLKRFSNFGKCFLEQLDDWL